MFASPSRLAVVALACSGLAFATVPINPNALAACNNIIKLLGSTKAQTNGAQYNASATGAYSTFNQLDRPTCIVFPAATSDVVTAMKEIYLFGSDYAVRGGGHSTMPGWNTINTGVLIDFSTMKAFSYNQAQNTISIQPGVLWGEVYAGLQAQGVSPVGGRQSDVGASGLMLGGGLSFLSPSNGYACDNYVSLDVVLANGTLVTATGSNKYSDLFRALKGGGSRFGIVTQYVVKAIHTGTAAQLSWYGGTINYPTSSNEAVIAAMDAFIKNNKDTNAVALNSIVNVNVPGFSEMISQANLFYNGTEAQFNATFATFLSTPSTSSTLSPLSYYNITNVLGAGNERTNGWVYGASALVAGENLFQNAYTHWLNFSNTFASELYLSVYAITPVLQHQIDVGNANGGNAFAPPNTPFGALQLSKAFPAGVTTISPDVEAGIQLLFAQTPRSPGVPLYLNESDENQNALTTYNWFQQLKAVYDKYDPTKFNINHLFGPNGLT